MPQLTKSLTLYKAQPPFLPKKELKDIYGTKNRTRTRTKNTDRTGTPRTQNHTPTEQNRTPKNKNQGQDPQDPQDPQTITPEEFTRNYPTPLSPCHETQQLANQLQDLLIPQIVKQSLS